MDVTVIIIGYRQMWAVLKDKHSLVVKRCVVLCCMCGASVLHFVINNAKVPRVVSEALYLHSMYSLINSSRSTVQMLLSVIDNEGVNRRRARRLKRRVYTPKQSMFIYTLASLCTVSANCFLFHRVLILYGILMVTISSNHMVLLYMDVSMGEWMSLSR